MSLLFGFSVIAQVINHYCQESTHYCQASTTDHIQSPKVDVIITLCVQHQLFWTLSVLNIPLNPSHNSSLCNISPILINTSAVLSLLMLKTIDSLRVCSGNPDVKFWTCGDIHFFKFLMILQYSGAPP